MPHAKSGGLVGRVLGGFVVREPLSSGGFGAVYRAEQVALAREAVIKVLHARLLGNETMVQRFLREARLASRLDHPYAAHIYAFGAEPDGLLWIAMELVRGTPLDRMLRTHGPISLERFVPLLERICEVVHSAHEQGIVHRDLKPANVMVLERSGRLLPKLLDFGIAKVSVDGERERIADTTPMDPQGLAATTGGAFTDTEVISRDDVRLPIAVPRPEEPADDVTLPRSAISTGEGSRTTTAPSFASAGITQVGTTVGSPLYMAPEQWTDAALTSARTDTYALGILCYEALTGRPPFNGASHFELALAHGTLPVPPLGAGFPPALDGVLRRALAKLPDDRYATALELAGAFRVASGVAIEPIGIPRLDVAVRSAALTRLPRPLALAVDAFDAARNAHQARDACWQLVRTAVRLVAVTALASHGHVSDPGEATNPGIEEGLRRLRDRHPSDAAWLAMARELARPFAAMRDAHPVPPLVELLSRPRSTLDDLLDLRDRSEESGSASEEQVLEVLEAAVPVVARLLDELAFLQEYGIAVPTERGLAEEWTGARRDKHGRPVSGGPLAAGRPVLVDADGLVAVVLWPFVQVHEPAPGSPDTLFLFDGKGRRGARLLALPDPFEHEDDVLWETFGAFFRATPDSFGVATPLESCPFPGLAAFTGADAAQFFGRERESEAFLNRLRVQPLLSVVGPSGAGKSSFVSAGVLPLLPAGWQSIALRPGPAPMVSLAARLDALGVARPSDEPADVAAALRAWATARNTTLVLFVDQLEELFTLCGDAGARARFADLLAHAARSAEDPLRVILTVRDDFLLRLESLPALRARLGPGLQLLTTPLEPELRRILTEPLRRAGYEFDDRALPDRIVAEVAGTPGALALLSFTASKLWELRDRRFHHITARAYESLAGVGGALAQHAEATLQAMHPEQQRLVREVFRHAVTAEGTRAVLTRAELTEVLGASTHAGHVIEKLLAARLLVVSDDERGGERIEVTHEALLDAWPRLVGWRREDAEGARLRDQLRAAARQWDERGRARGLLWRDDALAEYRLWRPRYPGTLIAVEEAFAAASLAEAARGRRLRRAAFAVAFVALAAFAIVLLAQNARVQRGARQMHSLLVNQYEDQGRRLLLADDPMLALAHLHEAAKLGASGPVHDFLVAQALRATDGELFVLHHDGMVGRVRFSPDGSTVATGSMDGTARLWNARTGALIARLEMGAPNVRVEWSRSGDRLAAGAANGAVHLVDARGKPVLQLPPAAAGIQTILFTPDGRRLVTATVQDEIAVWDAVSGRRLALLLPAEGGAASTARASVAVSHDGALVAWAGRSGVVSVWRLPEVKPIASWQAHDGPVYRVEFSPDGSLLATAGMTDRKATVWEVASHREVASMPHDQGVRVATFSPDGKRLLTASDDRTAAIWNLENGKRARILAGHIGAIWDAVWSPDGQLVATASDDGTAYVWEAASGRRVVHRVGHRGSLRDVAFDAAGTRVATVSFDGTAIVWSTQPPQLVTPLIGHQGDVLSAEFSPGGEHVLTGGTDGTARVWDATTGRPLLTLEHTRDVTARFSPDGRRIATACDDGVLRIWDGRSGARLLESKSVDDTITELAWNPAGTELTAVTGDGAVGIWSAESGELRRRISDPKGNRIHWVAFHPSRPLVVTSSDDGASQLWDSTTGRLLARFEDDQPHNLGAIDPTGKWVVSTTPSRTARVWRLENGHFERELVGHVGNVISASWSSDGVFILTHAMDGTARIWDASAGRMLAVVGQGDTQLLSASFANDMSKLVVGGSGGLAQIWELPKLEQSRARLEQIVRCRVPYTMEGEQLVPRARTPSDCANR